MGGGGRFGKLHSKELHNLLSPTKGTEIINFRTIFGWLFTDAVTDGILERLINVHQIGGGSHLAGEGAKH